MTASLDGANEIGFTILSMTFSLAAVFIPVLFMGGILGRLLHEFAVTIGAAILVSGFVSLTLTPMLCSRFLRPPGSERHGKFYAVTERWFDRMLDGYQRSLSWVMRHRRATMYFSGVLLLATIYMFYAIPKGFLPSEDADQLIIFTLAAQGISYDSMVEHQLAAASLIKDDPSIRSYFVSVGSGGPGGATQFGHHISASEAGVGAQAQRRSVDHEVAAGVEQRARAARVPAESAADPDRRAIHAQHVSDDAAEPEYRDALQVRADARSEIAPAARSARRQQRPASRKSAGHASISIATRRTRSASPPARSRTRSTTPTARARSRPSTRPTTSTG